MGKDFGDIEVKSKYGDKYKGKKGEVDRIGLIYPKNGGGPWEEESIHYHDKYFVCIDGICCEKKGPPDQKFACLIVKYTTNKQGQVISKEDEVPFDFKVMPWIISPKKMKQLMQKNMEFPLKEHDLMVSCDGSEEYQQLDFTPCKESVWQLKPEYKEAIWAVSESMRKNLKSQLGAKLDAEEIKELLGIETTVNLNNVMNDPQNVDQLLENV